MRSKVEVGYARGAATRDRIMGVAIQLFGNYGFDSVTTREIAAQSAVPPASLRYYFVNKEGLYVACLEHVQAMTFKLLERELEVTEALLLHENVDVDRLIESFCAMQDARIDSLMGGSDNGAAALFTIRHDLPSTGGAGNLGSLNPDARRMAACYIQVLSRISGNTVDLQSALIITAMISGQIVNLFLRRNRLAEMGWEFTPERLHWLKAAMRKQTSAILKSYQV